MAVTLVIDPACAPALYGALAASVALAQNAVLMHLPMAFTAEDGADAVQMVAAAGALVPSGLLWYERLTGREILPVSGLDEIIAAGQHGEVVVPLGTTPQSEALRAQLLEKAADACVPVTQLNASVRAGVWRAAHLNGQATEYGAWTRDRYGRWVVQAPIAPSTTSDAASALPSSALKAINSTHTRPPWRHSVMQPMQWVWMSMCASSHRHSLNSHRSTQWLGSCCLAAQT